MRRPSCQRHWPASSTMYSPIHFICRFAPDRFSSVDKAKVKSILAHAMLRRSRSLTHSVSPKRLDLGVRDGRSRVDGLRQLDAGSDSLLVSFCRFAPNRSAAFEKIVGLIADDDAIGAGTRDRGVIFLKERNCELGQADRNLKRAAGDVGGKFTGNERLLRAGSHACGDDVTVIEVKIWIRLALIVGGIDVHDEINILGARNEYGHLGYVADSNDAGAGSS